MIEVDCRKCVRGEADSCRLYGADASVAVARCAADGFKAYKKRDGQGWISAAEKLPNEKVGEYFDMNGEYPSYLVMIRGGVIPTIAEFDGEYWLFEDNEAYVVTHWMPLPAPPKKGERGV